MLLSLLESFLHDVHILVVGVGVVDVDVDVVDVVVVDVVDVDVDVVLSSLDYFHLRDDLGGSELDDLIQELNAMRRVAVQWHALNCQQSWTQC